MASDLRTHFQDLVPSLATIPVRRDAVRCVFLADLHKLKPWRFFHLAGSVNRCNPAGVRSLYCSEEAATAEWELLRGWRGTAREKEPLVKFRVALDLARVLDLGDPNLQKELDLKDADFFGEWLGAGSSTRLQALGGAVAAQREVNAIRYPSAAARSRNAEGWNVVVFPDALKAASRVSVYPPQGGAIETLP